ncbi:MAG: hypothetical protein ACXVB1_17855 [Pseudobdellovibrionaceae bacterium]
MKEQLSKFTAKIIFAFFIIGATTASAAVWQSTESWNSSWEQKYSDWVRDFFNEEIYTTGRYKNIPTDCSDAVYFARVIFAYENNLPFVIKDSTGGSNRITNEMSRFNDISDPLQRVRKFIDLVGATTSTKTLPNDTYPVAINRTFILPGTIWSRPRITKDNFWRRLTGGTVQEDPGHAELVKEVADTGAVYLIGSTVPKEVRKLNVTSSLVFMPVETSTGFRRWMQPAFYSQPVNILPGYSLEQFTTIGRSWAGTRSLSDWTTEVQNRLALREEPRSEKIARQVKNICTLVNSRVDIITKSELRRISLGGACMGVSDYDSYSTPSRDKRIVTTLKQLTSLAGGMGITAAQRAKPLKPFLDDCPNIRIAPTQTISLFDFSIHALKDEVSSDPNDSFGARWGLEESTSNCPNYE